MLQPVKRRTSVNAMTHRNQRGSQRDFPLESSTRILIVDSDCGIGIALTFMLAARGYAQVRAVRSARRAMTLAVSYRPALVFIDLDLPDGGAFDVAHQVIRMAGQPAPRLIALTVHADHERREESRVAGFERYLVKPLSESALEMVLRMPVATVLNSGPSHGANYP
jgi:DNA-binding response OmpR family regulator